MFQANIQLHTYIVEYVHVNVQVQVQVQVHVFVKLAGYSVTNEQELFEN